MSVQIREYSDRDLPIIVRLVNAAFRDTYQFFPYDEETFRTRIQEGRLRILVAQKDGEVLGSAAYHDGYWGEEIEWLSVNEIQDQKIVESTLVGGIEKYVKRGTVFTMVDAGSPKIEEWEERGYAADNGLYHMITRLIEEKPLPALPEDILLRSLRPNEEKEFVETVNAGFGWERAKMGDVEKWKVESPPFDEEWIHVAEIKGMIVSVVVAKPDAHFNRFFNGRRGYLGPATTLIEYRNKNLASTLTIRAMNQLLKRGMNSAALYTSEQNVTSATMLQKLGFKIEHHWKFMRKKLP